MCMHACMHDVCARMRAASHLYMLPSRLCPRSLSLHAKVLPTVCDLLHRDRARIRRAVLVGSLALLLVQLAWSTLGIALLPAATTAATAAAAAAAATATSSSAAAAAVTTAADPLALLLAAGGQLGITLSLLAAAAVSTTIIGTVLALQVRSRDACLHACMHACRSRDACLHACTHA